jgi:hypothetical protein
MYRVDITADLNDEDHTGYLWTFLDEARDPVQITAGALVVAVTRTPRRSARSSTLSRPETARSFACGRCPAR